MELATIARGARAGVVATGAMSAVMLGSQRLGLMARQPPEAVVDEATGEEVDGAALDALAVASHVAFGAGVGAGYALLTSDRSPVPAGPAAGVAAALGVWAASYAGWIPALGILPPPDEDDPGRQATMFVAHLVFGAVLGRQLQRSD